MTLMDCLVLAGIAAFAGASFFFAIAESSLFALGKWQASQLELKFPRRGAMVNRLLKEPSELLASIVLGNTLANGMIVALGLHQGLEGDWPFYITLSGLMLLILVVCEVWPKTLAVRNPKRWAMRVAAPMLWILKGTRPLHRLVEWINTLLLKGVLRRAVKPIAVRVDDEYRELLEMAFQQGALAQSEKEIIAEIMKLDQRTAGQVMTPISQVHCVSDQASMEEMTEAARKYKHRRVPLYDESTDSIVGVLDTRKLLLGPVDDLSEVMDLPAFVPGTMNLLQLMKALQRQKRGMAIVLNEFGGTAGMVSMTDILEEMLGTIPDEVEAQGFVMETLGTGKWRVNGTMRLDDFQREYHDLPDMPAVETIGGLMTSLMEVVPATGDTVQFGRLKLTATVTDERRVKELMIEETRRK